MSTAVSYGGVITEIQMHNDELDYVEKHIKEMPKDGLMVEWGSGGSTCRWLETLTDEQRLVSIEHNENWFNRVTRAVKNEFGDVEGKFKYLHIPEQTIEHGYATPVEELPIGCEEYINPKENVWDADIFFIDGIARAACALTVLHKKTKKNPVVMIHDYVGREAWYEWAVQFYDAEVVGKTLCRLHLKP